MTISYLESNTRYPDYVHPLSNIVPGRQKDLKYSLVFKVQPFLYVWARIHIPGIRGSEGKFSLPGMGVGFDECLFLMLIFVNITL